MARQPKPREKIVEALLELAAERRFEEITLAAIAERAGVTLATLRESYDGRLAVLADYIRGVDERVLAGIDPALAGEPPRERLFDVLFSRLEAHAPHKKAIGCIIHAARRDPLLALELNRLVTISMSWMLAAAGISSTGGRGLCRAQGLALVWAPVMPVWLAEEDAALPRTMAALDKRLREAERVVICVDRVEKFACRVRGAIGKTAAVYRRKRGPGPRRRPSDMNAPAGAKIAFDDFLKVDIRVGRIVEAAPFPQARKPALKLTIDFGPEVGLKKSSAQVVKHYSPEELVGKLVLAVVNFPPRQIGPFMSEVLTLGVPDEAGEVVLLQPSKDVPIGGRMY